MQFRQLPFLLLLCFLLPACGGKQTDTEDTDSIAVADSDTIGLDTIETDSVPVAAPPKKADELFDDFAYAFMRNKKFQLSRISFPLRNIVDGSNEPISKQQWRHDPLYSERDLYITVNSSRQATAVAKDTSINYVAILEIKPETQTVKQYHFNRVNSSWMLTEISHGFVADMAEENADFLDFYCKFSVDGEFQKHHVAEMVNINVLDESTGENIEGSINAEQWPDFAPELPKDEVMCVKYGRTFHKSSQRIVSISAPSGDAGVTMVFNKRGSDWLLTSYEN